MENNSSVNVFFLDNMKIVHYGVSTLTDSTPLNLTGRAVRAGGFDDTDNETLTTQFQKKQDPPPKPKRALMVMPGTMRGLEKEKGENHEK